jgi:hypothetical protein
MVSLRGEANVFIGPPPTAAVRGFFESSGWEPVTDLASTIRVLDQIVEQGEGARHSAPESHYGRFLAIRDEYLALKQRDPGFEPVRPVLVNPFARTPPEGSGPVRIFDDPFAVRVSDLFNETYGLMLQLLGRFFITTTETDAEASALCNVAIDTMASVLTPLGELLTTLPAGASQPGLNAGPSFVVRTVHALPHKESAWHILSERFDELAHYTDALAADSGNAVLKGVAISLAKAEASLTEASEQPAATPR